MIATESECRCREGKKCCIWWVTGCINPKVSLETKAACANTDGNLPRGAADGSKKS